MILIIEIILIIVYEFIIASPRSSLAPSLREGQDFAIYWFIIFMSL